MPQSLGSSHAKVLLLQHKERNWNLPSVFPLETVTGLAGWQRFAQPCTTPICCFETARSKTQLPSEVALPQQNIKNSLALYANLMHPVHRLRFITLRNSSLRNSNQDRGRGRIQQPLLPDGNIANHSW